MSRVLVFQNSCSWARKNPIDSEARKKTGFVRVLGIRKRAKTKSEKAGLASASLVLIAAVVLSGICYIYQVNSIATKGFELKEIETRIQEAEKEGNQLKIKEVELRSMYNIEKATRDLNLVTSTDISYVDMAGPVAMK